MNVSLSCALAYARRELGSTITSILLFVSGSPWTASTLITAYQTLSTILQRMHKYFLDITNRTVRPRNEKQPKCTKFFLLECEHGDAANIYLCFGRTIHLTVRPRPLTINHGVRTQLKPYRLNGKQYKQCRYNVTLRRVRVTTVSVEKRLSITYFESVSVILVI